MVKKAISLVKRLIVIERTPLKMTYASCVGIFIAFSPFIGFHWLMTILFAWLFNLNIAVIYAVSHIINNPFTMVPIYLADYAVGVYILNLLHIDMTHLDPWWVGWLNTKLACMGLPHLSLWVFLIGGNILAILAPIIAYPILLRFYRRILKQPAV